jgi:hypothetical protein
MALDHGDLGEVALRVGPRCGDLLHERLGEDLARDEADHARAAALPLDPEVRRRHGPHTDALRHPLGHGRRRDLLHGAAPLEHDLGHEPLQVGQQQQVGLVARGDRAVAREAVPQRGVVRGHHQRVLGRDAEAHGVADDRVHVPVLRDVLRLAVVGAERHPSRAELRHERRQGLEVARGGRLADQQPHPRAQPLASLLRREGLVVGADPGGGVGLQRVPEDAGRVPVDVVRALDRQLRQLAVGARDDAGEVHHLGEPDHALAPQQALEVAGREWPSRRLELRRGDLRRLEMDVRVDEARDDVGAVGVEQLLPVVRAEPGDDAVADRHVDVEPLPREDAEDAAAAHDQVGRLVAPRHRQPPSQITRSRHHFPLLVPICAV